MTTNQTLAAFRFGFGLPLPDGATADPVAMLAALGGPDAMAATYPGPRYADLAQQMDIAADMLRASRRSEGEARETARTSYRTAVAELQGVALIAAKTTIARALDAPDGLRERLAQFWADHFTTIARSRDTAPMPSAMVEEAIRPHLNGRFADMLKSVVQHPAMLLYLDQTRSFGPNSRFGQRRNKGLNENLARELLELHSVGGGYTQADVTQMAELLTGLTLGKNGPTFDKRRAEPGAETVLGKAYGGDTLTPLLQALDDLSQHPLTAAHMARKLAVHFVSDTPDPDLVSSLDVAWRTSGGDLMAVSTALLTHPAAWAPGQGKARQPYDFIVAALRALGLTGADVMRMGEGPFRRMILQPMEAMGQPWQSAPGPDGWPEAAAHWITPEGMASRITWAMEVPGRLVNPLPNPVALMNRSLGSMASARLAWAVPKSENIREAVGLVFASPEFNRR